MSRTKTSGDQGEALAGRYLEERGYTILDRQWRCRFGELDLVAEDGTYLCFVEVKLRKSAAYGSAGDFVDGRKQSRLRAAAELYLAKHPTDLQPRFDVIEIYAPQGTNTVNPRIFHLENAF